MGFPATFPDGAKPPGVLRVLSRSHGALLIGGPASCVVIRSMNAEGVLGPGVGKK